MEMKNTCRYIQTTIGADDVLFVHETDNYEPLIKIGKAIAVLKICKNNDGTYSNYIELYNCTREQKKRITLMMNLYRSYP